MKKLRMFDSLKFVLATVACTFILNVAHADETCDTHWENYVSATGTVSQNGTPTPTNPIEPKFYTQGEMVLRAVGNVADSYDATTGKITRRIGVKVFNGTESWGISEMYSGTYRTFWLYPDEIGAVRVTSNIKAPVLSNYFSAAPIAGANNATQRDNTISTNSVAHSPNSTWIRTNDFSTVSEFKSWLSARHAAGKPVVMYYQLATPVEEDWTSTQYCVEPIKIATTKYNEQQFAPVETDLDAAVAAVDTVVTQTMTQAQQIDQIANEKQTRPDESCPPFKKCLLVEDEDGTPHWYEIYDPINDFLRPILAAAALSGNQGAPVQTSHSDGSNTIIDTSNIFYNGSGAFRKKYIDNSTSAADRPFGPTTLDRCADNATRTTSTVDAGLCYNTGGMFRTLTEGSDDDAGEWALVWNGNEGGENLGITPGVVYGVAKCTSVGQHTTEITGDVQSGSEYWWPKKLNNYATSNPTTLASLITEYPNSNIETVFNQLPNPYGTEDNPEYPRANYRNCWCKMTAIGVPGSGDDFAEQAANGSIMSVAGGGWVFDGPNTSATDCARICAYNCAYRVRAAAAFRKNVLTVR